VLGLVMLFSQHLLSRVWAQILFGGVVPLIIGLFLYASMERADWFLNNRVTSFLGVLSYSLYLWQQPFVNRNSDGWWAAFPVNLLLALACAMGSYYIVERPFLRMGRKATGHGVGDAQVVP
jgi:peptidoglycan/LPS O-acetylase OafA/YrhL